jgi:saccharopine dehydrogenase (NAD+, L-lysine-forming)
MNKKTLFIRSETHPNEYRTPLIPRDVETLIRAGCTVYVQCSTDRVYKDHEYEQVGAILTSQEWDTVNPATLILGIKELSHLEKLRGHTHAYFSHSFKGQEGSQEILQAFANSQSHLYDFEYFTTQEGKRLISFGWYAGVAGAILGLQSTGGRLVPWSSIDDMLASVKPVSRDLRIAVVGWQGRCGSGVCNTLDKLQRKYSRFGKEADTSSFQDYDILYNCILLDKDYTKVWFSSDITPGKPITIVDISCDYSKSNNPIAVYKEATTWEQPVAHAHENLRIIAIENLPSLLPKESSDHFSSILTRFLLDETTDVWERALGHFEETLPN